MEFARNWRRRQEGNCVPGATKLRRGLGDGGMGRTGKTAPEGSAAACRYRSRGGIFREAVGNLLARGRGKKKKKRKARNGGKAKGCSGSYLNSSTLENSIL
jgi:hypothetical protein